MKFKKSIIITWTIILLIIVVPFLFPYIVGLFGYDYTYSEGVRVGQVIKFSEKGLIWKTYEVTMGLTQSGAYIEEWNFSIDSQTQNKQELVDLLTTAYQTGQLTEIKYIQHYGIRPWRSGTSYTLDQITLR